MSKVDFERETYLGDGLYASCDGWQIKLRAPRGHAGDHVVYLDPTVFAALTSYEARIREAARARKPEGE